MYSWIDFYAFLFMAFGLISAAIPNLRALSDSSFHKDILNLRQHSALAWWNFFSLTFGGMLIPISNVLWYEASNQFPQNFYPTHLWNIILIFYVGFIGIIMLVLIREYEDQSGNKKISMQIPSGNYIFLFMPFIFIMIKYSDLSRYASKFNIFVRFIIELGFFIISSFISYVILVDVFKFLPAISIGFIFSFFSLMVGFEITVTNE